MTGSLWVRRLWVLGVGLLAAAIGTVFFLIGLDAADKVASGAGLFVGLAGLAVSGYGTILARRPAVAPPADPAPAAPATPAAGAETVAAGERSVAVGGDNSGTIVTGDGNDVR